MMDEILKRHKKKFFFCIYWKEQYDFLRSALEEQAIELHDTAQRCMLKALEEQEKRLRLSEDEIKLAIAPLPINPAMTVDERMKYQALIAETIVALQNKEHPEKTC